LPIRNVVFVRILFAKSLTFKSMNENIEENDKRNDFNDVLDVEV
jgi:hypothetical protein